MPNQQIRICCMHTFLVSPLVIGSANMKRGESILGKSSSIQVGGAVIAEQKGKYH